MQFDFFGIFQIQGIWAFIIYLFIIVVIAFPLMAILFENRNPIKSISWILVLVLLPIAGLLLYLYFGRNYRKKKIFSKKETSDAEVYLKLWSDRGLEPDLFDEYENEKIKSKVHIMRLLLNNSRSILTERNRLKVLNNGSETFEDIIAAIEKATKHIHLEYYIVEDDGIGNQIKDLLIRKANEGVKIRLIFDDVGSWSLGEKYLKPLRDAGIEYYSFMPVRSYRFANKINYRNHRKIIVVDGKIAYVGGINIADRYLYGRDGKKSWRDTHLRIEGEAVGSLQSIFLSDWYFMSNKLIEGDDLFPRIKIRKKTLVQISPSGPDSDWSTTMQTFFSAIATAKESVYISTPYFLPNEGIITALRTASLSGVDVKLILPEKNDSFLTKWSSYSYIQDLLEAGIDVYLYQAGFTHSKIMMVDHVFSSIGTANMDIRSFDQNFEVNALIYDQNICEQLIRSFRQDLKNSKRLQLEVFMNRPLKQKFFESIARLFSPLL